MPKKLIPATEEEIASLQKLLFTFTDDALDEVLLRLRQIHCEDPIILSHLYAVLLFHERADLRAKLKKIILNHGSKEIVKLVLSFSGRGKNPVPGYYELLKQPEIDKYTFADASWYYSDRFYQSIGADVIISGGTKMMSKLMKRLLKTKNSGVDYARFSGEPILSVPSWVKCIHPRFLELLPTGIKGVKMNASDIEAYRIFQHLKNIQEIAFYAEEYPEHIEIPDSVTKIHLVAGQNSIPELHASSLTDLHVSSDTSTTVPGWIKRQKDLKKLTLHMSELQDPEISATDFPSLEILEFSYCNQLRLNQNSSLPSTVNTLLFEGVSFDRVEAELLAQWAKNVHTLHLRSFSFHLDSILNTIFQENPVVEKLSLRFADYDPVTFPESISKCKKLKTLLIESNELMFPSFEVPSLENLNLERTTLKKLPDLYGLKNLKTLSLPANMSKHKEDILKHFPDLYVYVHPGKRYGI